MHLIRLNRWIWIFSVHFLVAQSADQKSFSDETVYFGIPTATVHNTVHISRLKSGIAIMTSVADYVMGSYFQYFGEYEQAYIDLLKSVIPDSAGSQELFLDVGANVGMYAVPLGKHLEPLGGDVYSFEAVTENFHTLSGNLALNQILNVEIFNIALSDKLGNISFPRRVYSEKSNHGDFQMQKHGAGAADKSGSCLPSEGGVSTSPDGCSAAGMPGVEKRKDRVVAVETIDNLMAKGTIPRCPTMAKLDVELHEVQVLRGAQKMLSTCKPVLFIEIDCVELSKYILNFLDILGYSMVWVVGSVLPVMSPTVAASLAQAKGHDNEYLNLRRMLLGGVYAFALPSERSHEFEVLQNANPLISLIPINVSFSATVNDYGIKRCIDLYRNGIEDCVPYEQQYDGDCARAAKTL